MCTLGAICIVALRQLLQRGGEGGQVFVLEQIDGRANHLKKRTLLIRHVGLKQATHRRRRLKQLGVETIGEKVLSRGGRMLTASGSRVLDKGRTVARGHLVPESERWVGGKVGGCLRVVQV
jgi:hypothetical protein